MARTHEKKVRYRTAPKPKPKRDVPRTPDRTTRAKVFANGRSQAVRLPKEFRLSCSEVSIRREGQALILEPVPEPQVDAKGWRIGLWEELDRLRKELDVDDFKLEDDPVPEPIRPFDED
jgi:antitoxin VapB